MSDGAITERSDHRPGPQHSKAWILLPAAVSVGVFVVIFWRVDWAQLWTTLQGARIAPLLLGFILYLGVLLVQGWRWHILLQADTVRRWRLRDLEIVNFLSTFFDLIAPAKLGSDGYRLLALPDLNKHQIVSSLLAVRLLGLVVTAATALALTLVYVEVLRPLIVIGVLLLAALSLLVAKPAAGWAGAGLLRLRAAGGKVSSRAVDHTIEVTRALKAIATTPMTMLAATLLTGAFIGLNSVVFILAGEAFGMDVSPGRYVWATCLILLAAGLPISIQGRGVSEALAIYALGVSGVSIEQVILATLGKYAIALLYGLVAGALLLATRGRWAFSPVETTLIED